MLATAGRSIKMLKIDQIKPTSVWKNPNENRYARVVNFTGGEFGEVTVQERIGSPGRYQAKGVSYTARTFVKKFKLLESGD